MESCAQPWTRAAGRRKYSQALQALIQGLTVPSYAVNAIAIATYKKYALVSLIHNGEPCLLLLYALHVVKKLFQVLKLACRSCGPFTEVYTISGHALHQVRCTGIHRACICILQQKAARSACSGGKAPSPLHRGIPTCAAASLGIHITWIIVVQLTRHFV